MSPRFKERLLLAIWSLVLFSACFALQTRHNRFPFFYHPDEPGKVEQILTSRWNFNHPMLLLSTTKVAVSALPQPLSEQQVVEVGRVVSAGFMSAAIVALSLVAFLWRGWAGAFSAGAVLGLHHQLYELAHYMKEDSAMLFGFAVTFLAATMFWQAPSTKRAIFLGAACAFAVSGKYLGVLSLLVAGPVIFQAKNRPRGAFAIFAASFVAVFAIVNLPLLLNLATFQKSLDREVGFVVHGQREMTRSVPHAQYWSIFLDNSTPAIWVLLGFFVFARWRERRTLAAAEWAVVVFPFAYALLLSFSPKSNDRYFLPASAMFSLLAALGIEDAAHLLGESVSRRAVHIVAAVALVALQICGWAPRREGLWQYEEAFQHDDNQELIAWIKAKLPADAVIAKDNRVRLPDPSKKRDLTRGLGVIPQKVVTPGSLDLKGGFAADIGTIDEMLAKGITHVIVSDSDYGKFFLEGLRPKSDESGAYAKRKAFYETLFREGDLQWERDRGTVIYLHPGLRVYRLR